MGFVENTKRTGRALAVTAAVVAALSLSTAPNTAYAQRGGGGWHGGGGWDGGGGVGVGGVGRGAAGGGVAGRGVVGEGAGGASASDWPLARRSPIPTMPAPTMPTRTTRIMHIRTTAADIRRLTRMATAIR